MLSHLATLPPMNSLGCLLIGFVARSLSKFLSPLWSLTMARKPASKTEYVLFDVIYDDGSQRSNRRVPKDILGGLDGDNPARAVIEAQDREIAERSGQRLPTIKVVKRSS